MWFKPLFLSLVFIMLTTPHVRTQDAEKEGESEEELLKRCYGNFGCFSIGKPFLSIYRPINLFPAHPGVLNVHLFETSRNNPKHFQRLNNDNESTSDFDPTKPVKILVHDYLEDANHPWILQMIQELLTNSDCNVVTVDWSRGATLPYTQSVANARMVGAIIAKFLTDLQEKQSVPPSNIHIIGHGVGAHIAGYVGENVPGLGRITGLDPAGPYFQKTDPQVHLDPSDAEFVDVIHTNDEHIIVNGL
ncbi:inactive pancreatic lipase-related protein 1-like, partial [Limulus polyphemus]|uniref:Inactive pancreatic lipase-related protein 1-like n=1 Tax=Limulus polyphemus TaxID=6850 RepID=A0ABM1TS98_LIMPO